MIYPVNGTLMLKMFTKDADLVFEDSQEISDVFGKNKEINF
jgi:hypothetical protein